MFFFFFLGDIVVHNGLLVTYLRSTSRRTCTCSCHCPCLWCWSLLHGSPDCSACLPSHCGSLETIWKHERKDMEMSNDDAMQCGIWDTCHMIPFEFFILNMHVFMKIEWKERKELVQLQHDTFFSKWHVMISLQLYSMNTLFLLVFLKRKKKIYSC